MLFCIDGLRCEYCIRLAYAQEFVQEIIIHFLLTYSHHRQLVHIRNLNLSLNLHVHLKLVIIYGSYILSIAIDVFLHRFLARLGGTTFTVSTAVTACADHVIYKCVHIIIYRLIRFLLTACKHQSCYS